MICWQLHRSLVGMSQHPQFKALDWMPQHHPCCHVQKDNTIFEHVCQPGLFCETSQDEFNDRFQLPRTMGLVEAPPLAQGFHGISCSWSAANVLRFVFLCAVQMFTSFFMLFQSSLLVSTALDASHAIPSLKLHRLWEKACRNMQKSENRNFVF